MSENEVTVANNYTPLTKFAGYSGLKYREKLKSKAVSK